MSDFSPEPDPKDEFVEVPPYLQDILNQVRQNANYIENSTDLTALKKK